MESLLLYLVFAGSFIHLWNGMVELIWKDCWHQYWMSSKNFVNSCQRSGPEVWCLSSEGLLTAILCNCFYRLHSLLIPGWNQTAFKLCWVSGILFTMHGSYWQGILQKFFGQNILCVYSQQWQRNWSPASFDERIEWSSCYLP